MLGVCPINYYYLPLPLGVGVAAFGWVPVVAGLAGAAVVGLAG